MKGVGEEKKRKKAECDRCGNKWDTEGKGVLVTCSSCGLKVPNPNHPNNQEGDPK